VLVSEIFRQAVVAELHAVEADRPVSMPYPAIRSCPLFWEPVPPVASKIWASPPVAYQVLPSARIVSTG